MQILRNRLILMNKWFAGCDNVKLFELHKNNKITVAWFAKLNSSTSTPSLVYSTSRVVSNNCVSTNQLVGTHDPRYNDITIICGWGITAVTEFRLS